MSIQSEITRISTNVSDTLNAVSELGGTVASGAGSDDMATAVRSIANAVVRYDTPQTLTDDQQEQARTNIGAMPSDYTAPVVSVNGQTGEVQLTAENVGAANAEHTHVMNDIGGLADALLASGQAVKLWPQGSNNGSAGNGATISAPGLANYNIILVNTSLGICVGNFFDYIGEGRAMTFGGFNVDSNAGTAMFVCARINFSSAGCTVVQCNRMKHDGSLSAATISSIYGILKKG